MTESNEPLWVGMDVDAELARYAEEDRRRALAAGTTPPPSRLPHRHRGLVAALPRLTKGGRLPQSPLAA